MFEDSRNALKCSTFVPMQPARPLEARSLSAVDIDGVLGDDGYLQSHPSVIGVTPGRDGGWVAWIDDTPLALPDLAMARPDRPADVELHGPGAPNETLAFHPRAEHVEIFFDGLGDPEAAPRGWWHASVWLRRPEPALLLRWRADPIAFGSGSERASDDV
jgi:hypothetical protein